MIEAAARLGIAPLRALWRLTPAELELAAAAWQGAQARRLEWADALAWLVGSYVAVGLHAPKRYPKRPGGVRRTGQMTDEEMKRAALAFAARHQGGEAHGHDA